jgi:hypothetical protein
LWSREDAYKAATEVFAGERVRVSDNLLHKMIERAFDLGINSPRAFLNSLEKFIAAKGSLAVLDPLGEESPEVKAVCQAVLAGDWNAFKRAWSSEFDSDSIRTSVCNYLRVVLMNSKNPEEALSIAEALKELASYVQDWQQDNNILARLYLATTRMSLVERRR